MRGTEPPLSRIYPLAIMDDDAHVPLRQFDHDYLADPAVAIRDDGDVVFSNAAGASSALCRSY